MWQFGIFIHIYPIRFYWAVIIIGVSLSNPHTSEKFGTVVAYTNNYGKKRAISILY